MPGEVSKPSLGFFFSTPLPLLNRNQGEIARAGAERDQASQLIAARRAQVVADVRAHFGERVYQTVIPRTVRLSEAPSFGKSVLEHDPHGTGARAYRALAKEFRERHEAPAVMELPAEG